MKGNILVTGIGGVVGQGILRNIASMAQSFRVVGVNVDRLSAGNYMCDRVYQVPFAYDDTYIPTMRRICETENIGLIIPSTDYEAFYLSQSEALFSCAIAASPSIVTEMCLDKFMNWEEFSKLNIPFARSVLPSDYRGQFEKIVVKPRKGRGSRSIYINPHRPNEFDDTYVVQEYLEGEELTTAFYIKRDGSLHGLITFLRELEQGNTAKAEVVLDYDESLLKIIELMIAHFEFRGSINIQSRVTTKGIIPFEINCRISGTNSIRSQFGFKDVQYTVQEYLLNTEPDKVDLQCGSALRIVLDIIYPGMRSEDISDKKDTFYIY